MKDFEVGTKEWAENWCKDFMATVEAFCKADDVDGCDVCPFRNLCYPKHNGFLAWWTSTKEKGGF